MAKEYLPEESWATPVLDPVVQASKKIFGINYPFPWQRLIIAAVLDAVIPVLNSSEEPEPLRQIAVLPTGAGKSLCWMLPAVIIQGLTVAVFPLLSLITDQERRLRDSGVPAVCLQGGQNRDERRAMWNSLESGKVKIVLTNPEMLQSSKTADRLAALKPVFLVVDETHTVSQWGESFRPACAGIGRLVQEWAPPAVLALTATAGPHIRSRITALLFNGESPREALADPDRPTIRFGILPSLSRFHSLELLIRKEKRPAIVFGPTRSSVQRAARILRFRLRDNRIKFYHAGLSASEKRCLEAWYLKSSDGVLCATCAYGMGVDKSNIRTVVHMAPPSSTESYLQESGRASRDGQGANAWLVWTPEDIGYFDVHQGEAPVSNPINQPIQDDIIATRHASMATYAVGTDRCRREILLESLGITAQDCNGCDVCGGDVWRYPPEELAITQFFRWNTGRFRKGQAARILIGRRSAEVRQLKLDRTRGFGILTGWELEDAEEAISNMTRAGKLRYMKWGTGRGCLGCGRRKSVSQSMHTRKKQP